VAQSRDSATSELERLLEIIARLRSPDGCAWDRTRTPLDVNRYLVEEAYETVDAVIEGSPDHIKEELGDLLFQILFLAHMFEEADEFDIAQVMSGISEKMIRRHPHVFGTTKAESVESIRRNWEEIKKRERGDGYRPESVLEDIPRSLPPMVKARKIGEKAARAGFDWDSIEGVLDKVEEEINEFKAALLKHDAAHIEEEFGDLLFSMINLSRFAAVDPDRALLKSIAKFAKRYTFIEAELKKAGKDPQDAPMEEMNRLWNLSKER
jgi:tetrapyrrole methylase family protein/MazG family protein